uniref:Uncharacterized protein n=1 Tax=Setaria digitata TaxID=48799 RepID=A0A915PLR4_9BILA
MVLPPRLAANRPNTRPPPPPPPPPHLVSRGEREDGSDAAPQECQYYSIINIELFQEGEREIIVVSVFETLKGRVVVETETDNRRGSVVLD